MEWWLLASKGARRISTPRRGGPLALRFWCSIRCGARGAAREGAARSLRGGGHSSLRGSYFFLITLTMSRCNMTSGGRWTILPTLIVRAPKVFEYQIFGPKILNIIYIYIYFFSPENCQGFFYRLDGHFFLQSHFGVF